MGSASQGYKKRTKQAKTPARQQVNVTPLPANQTKMPRFEGSTKPKSSAEKWRASFGLPVEMFKNTKPAASQGKFTQTSGLQPFNRKAEETPVSIEQALAVSRRIPQANANQSRAPQPPGYLYPGRLQELTAGTGYYPDAIRWEPGNIGPGIHQTILTPPQPGGLDSQGRRIGPAPTTSDFTSFFGEQPLSFWGKPQFGPPAPEQAQWPPEEYELPPFQGPPAPLPNEAEIETAAMPAFTGGYEDDYWPGYGGGGGGGGYTRYPSNWYQQMYNWRL
jgi:hypothetical protein